MNRGERTKILREAFQDFNKFIGLYRYLKCDVISQLELLPIEFLEESGEFYQSLSSRLNKEDKLGFIEDVEFFVKIYRKFPLKDRLHGAHNLLNIKYYYDLIAISF